MHPATIATSILRRRHWRWLVILLSLLALLLSPLTMACARLPLGGGAPPELEGRLVAVGVPGAGAISAVGTFHPGSPIRDKPAFAAFTQAGKVLDPERLFVASTSNFGAPLARADQPPGAILSIDPRGSAPLVVPVTFAASGGQASTLDGRVMLYTAQSPTFVNKVYNPNAVTAELPAVANPTGISINNAFGRPWFTSMPGGAKGTGVQSVIDPDGRPLDGAPNKVAGGVFAGSQTDRAKQLIPGALTSGALGTALLGKSSDDSNRAVFAGVQADGSLVQIHVEKGVDGLAPAGTIKALEDGGRASRVGMAFNWSPNEILYVADPLGNAVVALNLLADGQVVRVAGSRRLTAGALSLPVDLAPAIPEIANPAFASNTTLAGDSDLYVLNRGNGTIVRLKQDGTVVAARQVTLPGVGALGADRLNGIAVSADASRLWVTVSGRLPDYPDAEGAVIELPAFSAAGEVRR